MTELFYVSGLDLMVKVEYAKRANSLRYASHRALELDEKVMTEQFIRVRIAPKFGAGNQSATLVYLGVDVRLKQRVARLHEKNDMDSLNNNEKEISAAVNSLIHESMRNYYTEQIGALILSARIDLRDGRRNDSKRAGLRQQMSELLSAYNVYADHKVTLNEIIPSELRPYWPGLEEESRYAVTTQG